VAKDRAGLGPLRLGWERVGDLLRSRRSLVAYLFVAYAFAAVLLWGASRLARTIGVRDDPAAWGFAAGVSVTAIAWAWWSIVRDSSGAGTAFSGALGEMWTADELRKLGDGWTVLSHIPFRPSGSSGPVVDIDHVAVGPYGAIVVEAKRTSHSWNLARPDRERELQRAAAQAADNAARVRRLLKPVAPQVPAVAVVICWGANLRQNPDLVAKLTVGGETVRVVAGRQSEAWLPRLNAERVPPEAVATAVVALRKRIDDDERWRQSRSDVTQVAAATARVARRIASSATVAAVVEIGFSVAAFNSSAALRVFRAISGFGAGFGAVVFFLLPVALAAGAVALARWSVHISRTVQGDVRSTVLVSGAAGISWVLFVVGAIVTGH
jgi:hypothetical protein